MRWSISPRLGLDMGTSRTSLWAGRRIVYSEPTLLVVEAGGNRVLYSGTRAAERLSKPGSGEERIRPVRRGAIADYAAAVFLLRKALAPGLKTRALKPIVAAAVPMELSSVETRALCDAAREAGAGAIWLVPTCLASLWSCTDRASDPAGSLMIDMGAGATDIAVIAAGQIIVAKTVKLGGDDITALVRRVMEISFGVQISEGEAERLKAGTGVDCREDESVEKIRRDPGTGAALQKIAVPKKHISDILLKGIEPVFAGIVQALEETPPELFEDIFTKGVMLTGGSSLLPGLGRRLNDRLQLKVNRLPDPQFSAIRGIGRALTRFDRYREHFAQGRAV